jgi:hypothetical protein
LTIEQGASQSLSNLALGEMQSNPNWKRCLAILMKFSTKKLEELLAMIDGQTAFLGIDFDPKDLETIKAKIEK